MVDRALSIVGLDKPDSHINMHDTPAVNILHSDPDSEKLKQKWNY